MKGFVPYVGEDQRDANLIGLKNMNVAAASAGMVLIDRDPAGQIPRRHH